MSSTYESALQAAQNAQAPVHVVDSKTNSLTQGFQLLAAARVREGGGTAQAMIAAHVTRYGDGEKNTKPYRQLQKMRKSVVELENTIFTEQTTK